MCLIVVLHYVASLFCITRLFCLILLQTLSAKQISLLGQ